MQTIILYKVVYFDIYNDLQERDFVTIETARAFSTSHPGSKIYKVAILGSIEELQ